jgi:hypothetical protein
MSEMELVQGVQKLSSRSLDEVLEAARRPDTAVYVLPELGVRNRDTFFEAVRQRFPLDPPVHTNYSWEALKDSLWSGIDALDIARVVIVWPNWRVMAEAAPRDYEIAASVWEDLAEQLHDDDATVGRAKHVAVVLV